MKILVIVTLALIMCFVSSCVNIAGGEWHYEEIERVKSPDGIVDAVLVRGGGGATTGFTFSVFLVPVGTKFNEKIGWFDHGQSLFSADHQRGLQLVWRKPKFLEVRFAQARIFKFSNIWRAREVENYGYVIELRLVPLDENSSLDEKDKS